MAVTKLVNLIALSSLALLACSFGATPTNALSVDTSHHLPRHAGHGHVALAKKKRASNSKRCKPRSTSSIAQTTTAPPKQDSSPTTSAAPKTTSSKAAAPPASSPPASTPNSGGNSGSNGGNGKVGIAWANGDETTFSNFKNGNVGPIYTWSPFIPSKAKSLGFDPIPMLWGEKQVDDFKRLVVRGYAKTVLGFNEPNQAGQSDMSPQRAAQLWKQYIDPLKNQGYSLISPACTSAPSGKTWMKDFFAACQGCHFDGLAIHFYGTSPQDFIDYITDFHNTFGLPIWPTEFACQNFGGGAQCNKDQVFNFMSTVKNFMDSVSWVPHYFAFGMLHDMGNVNPLNQLLASNGQPTDLGKLYIS